MKVTTIKSQVKNANRVSVFVDGKYSFSLTLDQLLDSKLKKSDLLEEADIKKFNKLSDDGKVKQRALEWLMIRPHSTREFHDYLYRKNVDKDLGEAWKIEFTDKKYLDDENFARWFSDQRIRKNKSVRAINSELRSKGVQQSTIQKVLGEIDTSDIVAIKKLIEKVGKRPRYKDTQKLVAYLAGKGFNYGDIKKAMSNQS